ncbi:MAG: hypothetical protein K2X27_02690 [Candidatus Obscuribacterales bacterium]|nr:hypothetical protein [Candidatus Obscuribacterales bacterium]
MLPHIRNFRQNRGSALFELCGVGFLLVTMALISVNVGVLIFAAWLNDSACRDACRAAAQQDTADDAKNAAIIACKQFATQAGDIIGNPVVLVDDAHFQFEPFLDADGKPQPELGPFVRVSTSLNTKLPAKVIYSDIGFTDQLVFQQTYTFPLLEPGPSDTDDTIDDAAAQQAEDDLLDQTNTDNADGADE